MNTAEQLRQQLAEQIPFTRREFLDAVSKRIARQGYYSMGFGSSPTTKNSLETASFKEAHRGVLTQWAKDAGFRVTREFSCYGVPSYFIEL
jgi:hypothetical protein